MKFVPVDTSRLELRYVETVAKSTREGVQKLHADGRPVWAVRCLAREIGSNVPENAKPEIIEVAIPNLRNLGEVLNEYALISFDNFRVFPWAMGQDGGGVNSGLAYSADGCATERPSTNGTKAKAETATVSA